MTLKEFAMRMDIVVCIHDKVRNFYWKHVVSDEKLIKKAFLRKFNRQIELNNPVTYSEKLQWLKLHWYNPLATKCADKYEVRSFITQRIGGGYLNKLYGVYDSVSEIDFKELPEQFVLKATHSSGSNIICADKGRLEVKVARRQMKRWLANNYYLQSREWVYRDITPRVICEELLQDQSGKVPMDYKIFCFHGEPKLIQVDIDRFGEHKQNFYNSNWEFQDVRIWCENDEHLPIERPKRLDEMLEISRKLSVDFPHVRVDLYHWDDRIIFGELTFFHLSGLTKFIDADLDREMGSWLNLSLGGNDGTKN